MWRGRGSENRGEASEWKILCLGEKRNKTKSLPELHLRMAWTWEERPVGKGKTYLLGRRTVQVGEYFNELLPWRRQVAKCKMQTAQQRNANGMSVYPVEPTQEALLPRTLLWRWWMEYGLLSPVSFQTPTVSCRTLGDRILTIASEHSCYSATSFKRSQQSVHGTSFFLSV